MQGGSIYTSYLLMSHLRTLASTHFEPTSARMAFPCFDEPSFKANFSVRIRRSPEYFSLSNMPVVSVEDALSHMLKCIYVKWPQWIVCEFQVKTVEVSDGLLEDQFDASVKMSTYLVAFVICDFKSVTATTSSGVQVCLMIFEFFNSFASNITFSYTFVYL